jgi:hypothetical protein
MTSQVYPSINADRWARLQTLFAQKAGVPITGDSGTAQDKGIHFSWAYTGESLTVTVISVPWYLPVSEQDVVNQFSTWVASVV